MTKTITLVIVALLMSIFMTAQKDISNEFKAPTGTTKEADIAVDIEVGEATYSVMKTSTNNHYYLRTSKAGNVRREYLGYSTDLTIDGESVYSNRDVTTFYVVRLNRNGYLSKYELARKEEF